jgi:MFS family permease
MDMAKAGPISTITSALASLVGALAGGYLSDRWVQKNLQGRVFTGAIGMALTIPSLFLLGYAVSIEMILLGGILFGFGFGMFDVNNMPILCQFVSPRYRATGYGIMNLAGISAGAVITGFLGKSADAGNMRHDFALLSIVVVVAIVLNLIVLRPKTINMTED